MDLQAAMQPVSEMVSIIGSPDFGAGFCRSMNGVIGFDHCTVFVCATEKPLTVVAEANPTSVCNQVRELASSCTSGGYLSDPIWSQFGVENGPGCSTNLLSPSTIADRRFREEFYVKPKIKHELALTGAHGRHRVYAAFYREQGGDDFSPDAVGLLRRYGNVLIQILLKHAEVAKLEECNGPAPPRETSRAELFNKVRSAIFEQGRVLTAREAEICAGIVLGYTVLGLSLNLGISINTVATHRKRAYAKLRISSQNELFARYFSLVESNVH